MTPRRCQWILAAAILLYIAVLGLQSEFRHEYVESTIFDLGIHEQALWGAGQGLSPFLSTRGLNLEADHFSPLVFLLAPFYQIGFQPYNLFWLQSAIFALGALPVYGLARLRSSEPLVALGFALLYLLHPSLQWINLFDFHFNALIVTALLYTLFFLREGPLWRYWTAALLVLLCGEAGGMSLLFLTFEAYRSRGAKVALATVLLALGGLGLASAVMARHNPAGSYQYGLLYCHLRAPLWTWIGGLFSWSRLLYLLALAVSVGGLALRGLDGFLPALPVLAGNLLTWRYSQQSLNFQYNAAILPFLMWAAILGQSRLAASRQTRLTVAAFVVAVTANLLLGPVSGPFWHRAPLVPRSEMELAWGKISEVASLAADNHAGASLSRRTRLYLFPNPFQPIAWGTSPQALIDQTGMGVDLLPPGAFRRAMESVPVDYVIVQPQRGDNDWPLNAPDRLYCFQQLTAYPGYTSSLAGGCVVFSSSSSHVGTMHYPRFDLSDWQAQVGR